MERPTHTVNAVAEASSSSRANDDTLTEGETATVLPAGHERSSRSHERPLGLTDAATDEPTPTINRPNATTEGQTTQPEPTTDRPRTRPEPSTLLENTRPSISRSDTCHPFGVALRDMAVPAC